MTATQPLREEHRELVPHIQALREVADGVGVAPADAVRRGVDQACEFLSHHLIPHAEAEERVLYPVVQRLLGAPRATATMSRDHVEIGRLVAELTAVRTELGAGAIGEEPARALRRLLYGLHALVSVHFAKEEEVYLPLLDAGLTPEAAREMFAEMERAAGEAKARQRAAA